MVGDVSKKTPEPRVVFLKKTQLELGVHLCGGNLHGVFVAEVEDGSPAKGPDGLMPGDLILEVSLPLSKPVSSQACTLSGDTGDGGSTAVFTWQLVRTVYSSL
jgi:C-terminal processing protease CtpA/Prc